mmetsp:Transcript_4810/g.13387  ORF Transcript_4810/g.13387 Transcript_4810/m.13387 type:complete len:120 (+) Transcript_4810:272-631(+)
MYKWPIGGINPELATNSPSVLECFAIEASYRVLRRGRPELQPDTIGAAEHFEFHEMLGFDWDCIEDLDHEQAEHNHVLVAAESATSREKLALEKHMFKQRFDDNAADGIMGCMWGRGLT